MLDYNKISKLILILTSPQVYLSSCKYLFIISHMRSRSSLLSHILGSNPAIAGHSELHRKYLGMKDIFILRARVYLETRENLHKKYVLDKILHNPFSVADNIFYKKNTFFIFLLREPEATMKSILEMGRKTNIIWQKDIDLMLRYYVRRLAAIEEYALRHQGRFFYIDSERLIDDTETILQELSEWLALDCGLNAEYNIFNNTGGAGHGDPSNNITLGKVIKTPNKKNIEIPEEVLRKGREAYRSCIEIVAKYSLNCGGKG